MPECPNCGQENPDGFVLCGMCGTRLGGLPRPNGVERKVVTVLFCDLVGFTASSDRADPEDVHARIGPYHARLRADIERFGGTVEKFIGDAVMAVFGAPLAHEDDAERAVRAGLRILDAISDLNREDSELDLQVRVGIETGEAVVTLEARPEQGEGFVTGDVVNTASRLQGVAPVNGVVVGEGTYSATKHAFDYEALEPAVVKGKAAPVPLWLATAARARLGTDLGRNLTTPLVGRELERGLLVGIFERAVHDESVQLVTIVGEPGVGKSRLVAELFAHVEDRPNLIRWRQGRCLSYGEGVTFWALSEIVKAEAGILETDSPEVAASKLEAVVPDGHPDAPWLRQRLRPLVGLEAASAAREENFAAWRGFLEAISAGRPSVFVFEDLHWADDALLGFLEHMSDFAEGVPMLLVGTARPELFSRMPTWASAARNSTRINLAPLSESETATLVANLVREAVLPSDVQRAILQRAGGNPLYAQEFVLLLKDQRMLRQEGASWAFDPDGQIPIPSGVQGLIAARLDTLAPDRKQLLQDAAVIGKVFWSGAVAQMGERDLQDVQDALHELSRKELIRPARASSMAGQAEFSFAHSLLRDVCYAQIPRASRVERHTRAAAWIEDVGGGGRIEDHAEILAAHYLEALDLALALKDPRAEEFRGKAVPFLTLAGDRAMGISVEAAERHYVRALELGNAADATRPALLARHGEALRQRGRFPDAAQAYEEAIAGFRAQGDVRAMAVTMGRYGIVLLWRGDPRRREIRAEAVAALEPFGPSAELAQALTEQAGATFVANEEREAIAIADRAIGMARDLGMPEPARALGIRGAARAVMGDAAGIEDMRTARDAATDQGLGREVALLHVNLASSLVPIEGPRAAQEELREGLSFAERRGIEEFVLASAAGLVTVFVDLGSYEEAMSLVTDLLPRLERADAVLDLLQVYASQIEVLTRRGDYGAAVRHGEWVAEKARISEQAQSIAQALPPVASLRLALGEPAEAIALLAELERVPNIGNATDFVASLADTVRTALAAGEADLAARLSDRVEPIYAMHDHALTNARALLLEHDGSSAEAAESFAQAAEGWRQFEMPCEQAQALLGQGRCLLTLGRQEDAASVLSEAGEILAGLGAKPALGEAESLLRQATGPA